MTGQPIGSDISDNVIKKKRNMDIKYIEIC